ncbi:hypothetical protein IMSHALPRED_002302 [Imshaugia aleurites]|uniref:Uncharacterized protein n=1 Tax=Imshaugia aleurites TaxID=172621 RepID=A0A8H3F653_9LECA|nr:hypothetical protein IMSHALPRED_002302 [Imshaugia aleurites]
MGGSHHWYDEEHILNAGCYLTVSSWCGSVKIQRCVEIGHLYQCHIHPDHYSRKPGKCIECQQEWERRERAQRDQDRAMKLEKKARDTANGNLANTRNGMLAESATKPVKQRPTPIPKVSMAQKPGKWPLKQKKEIPGSQLASEVEQAAEAGQDDVKGKGKTQGLSLYKAKKKWKDGRASLYQG